jgi:hypothetical protein
VFASETVVQYEVAHLFTSEVDELLGVQGAGQCGNTQRVPEKHTGCRTCVDQCLAAKVQTHRDRVDLASNYQTEQQPLALVPSILEHICPTLRILKPPAWLFVCTCGVCVGRKAHSLFAFLLSSIGVGVSLTGSW